MTSAIRARTIALGSGRLTAGRTGRAAAKRDLHVSHIGIQIVQFLDLEGFDLETLNVTDNGGVFDFGVHRVFLSPLAAARAGRAAAKRNLHLSHIGTQVVQILDLEGFDLETLNVSDNGGIFDFGVHRVFLPPLAAARAGRAAAKGNRHIGDVGIEITQLIHLEGFDLETLNVTDDGGVLGFSIHLCFLLFLAAARAGRAAAQGDRDAVNGGGVDVQLGEFLDLERLDLETLEVVVDGLDFLIHDFLLMFLDASLSS
jgi:hypothetical protein